MMSRTNNQGSKDSGTTTNNGYLGLSNMRIAEKNHQQWQQHPQVAQDRCGTPSKSENVIRHGDALRSKSKSKPNARQQHLAQKLLNPDITSTSKRYYAHNPGNGENTEYPTTTKTARCGNGRDEDRFSKYLDRR